MVNPIEDYEQQKINSTAKQTVIINENETGETDEHDPDFHDTAGPEDPDSAPDSSGDATPLDVEGAKQTKTEDPEDPGLNHTAEDDLSLNKPDNDLF
ncbi:hypothetical protein ACTHQF_07335 [Pedobacter sp. SAFR-022]|uniref:hypothetical protein n=1 Tax=Pedobacter sp. SAFR-022 TaxID=3436861 RepID=UPI003F7F96C9